MKNFSLVLSGGGAFGIAHLGVIHDMEKKGYVPSEVIGTSMGGIIAACISIGMKEKEIYKETEKFSSLLNWVKFSFSGNSIVSNEKIEKIFNNIFENKKIKDTKIPLKIITTNLLTGEKKTFTKDDDVEIKYALMATMAIPGVFQEQEINGIHYGDGFLCENLAISESTHNKVIAVDVLGKNSFNQKMPDNFFKTSNVIDMFEKSMRLLIYNQTKRIIKNSNKEIILLEPITRDFKTFQFNKYKEIRNLGLNLI